MTLFSKDRFYSLRRSGMSLAEIADTLGVSRNTIKSFARRNTDDQTTEGRCAFCRRPITSNAKSRFCSRGCRYAWNYSHRTLTADNASSVTCRTCGKKFYSYPSSHRKYCSRRCYIADRYGKAVNPHE